MNDELDIRELDETEYADFGELTPEGDNSARQGLVVRTSSIGSAENAARFAYPPRASQRLAVMAKHHLAGKHPPG